MANYTYNAISLYIEHPEFNPTALRLLNALVPTLALDRLFPEELDQNNDMVQKMHHLLEGHTIMTSSDEERYVLRLLSSQPANILYDYAETLYFIPEENAPANTPADKLNPHSKLIDDRLYIFFPICSKRDSSDIVASFMDIIQSLYPMNASSSQPKIYQAAIIENIDEADDFNDTKPRMLVRKSNIIMPPSA